MVAPTSADWSVWQLPDTVFTEQSKATKQNNSKEKKLPDLSEQSLLAACINGNRAAWSQFVERFSQLVFWAIRKRISRTNYQCRPQDLEDIFQNVFALIWEKQKLRQIKQRGNVASWLAIVAANCAVNYFRKKQEHLTEEGLLPEQAQHSYCEQDADCDQEKLHNILKELLDSLVAQERIILKLNYLYDKTHQEIARLLKMPENTVSSIIKRTKQRLRERLDSERPGK